MQKWINGTFHWITWEEFIKQNNITLDNFSTKHEILKKLSVGEIIKIKKILKNQEQKEMECKQEERIADLENGKAKPIVTVHRNFLTRDYSLEDVQKELGDEYHVIPVLNHEAIRVSNSITTSKLWNLIDATDMCVNIEPELKASDFPCIDYGEQGMGFHDGKYEYIIKEGFKRITTNSKNLNCIIDKHITVEKCKLSDIKPGDYFFLQVPGVEARCENYRYCTYVDRATELLFFDCGYGGYIRNEPMGLYTKNADECLFVKFTLK